MRKMLDRRRLKDRIVVSISKAVKQIQEHHFCQARRERCAVKNGQWSVNRLCEHLDHAFLHGLRHITNGYWVVVKEFTHKAIVKDISRLQHVTTNLGRGRAWLYMALNDQLLESYLRCFMSNVPLVKKFYVREALVLDQQQMELLVTLASGLEHICFQLDVDLPYLDLSSSMPVKERARERGAEEEEESDDDHVSLCSMDSSLSQSSLPRTDSGRSLINADSASQRSSSSPNFSLLSTLESSSGISGCDLEIDENIEFEYAQSALEVLTADSLMTRIRSIETDNGLDYEDNSVEVIHVRSKGPKLKKKKTHKKTSGERNVDFTFPKSGSQTSKPKADTPSESNSLSNSSLSSVSDSLASLESKVTCLDEKDFSKLNSRSGGANNVVNDSTRPSHGKTPNQTIQISPSDCIKVQEANDSSINVTEQNSEKRCVSKLEIPERKQAGDHILHSVEPKTVELWSNKTKQEDDSVRSRKLDGQSYDCDTQKPLENINVNHISSVKIDLQTCNGLVPKVSQNADKSDSSEGIGPQTCAANMMNAETDTSTPVTQPRNSLHNAEIRVDNNALLWLMLEIFQDEEEQFVKMFITSQGHSEGAIEPLYLLITTMRMYLLTRGAGETKYRMHASIKYTELDFISLSMNYQMLNLVCTNRRKQFWLTTGDQMLTKCIIGHLDNVVRHSELDLPRLSVLTDATTQRITMKKWAATECDCQSSDVSILCYTLVHWEDLNVSGEAGKSHGTRMRARHDGVMLHKSYSSYFSAATWRPYYFVLRDGVLYQYSEEGDRASPKMAIHLSGEDVSGCRRSPQSDQSHSFELLLSDGSAFQLSVSSAAEAQGWLQALCQAVAEGQHRPAVSHASAELLACCLVLTHNKLLLCHEDVQTNFFRLLGSASVTDITGILIDSIVNTYCVLEFESQETHISSERWALYFNAGEERDKFKSALSYAWKEQFQVEIPVTQTEDLSVQKKCREGVAILKAIFRNTAGV